ncbi:MAG: hypothetical protein Ta2D_05230 [Rickettsiales bacterium]|nr:MAG: hypothetical protein Ta2D_05230 [Rickettsiales bacterium]
MTEYIYIAQQNEESRVKIGKTSNYKQRLKMYSEIGTPFVNQYNYLFIAKVSNMTELEKEITENFTEDREDINKEMYFYNDILFNEYVNFIKNHKLFIKEIPIKKVKEKVKVVRKRRKTLKERGKTNTDELKVKIKQKLEYAGYVLGLSNTERMSPIPPHIYNSKFMSHFPALKDLYSVWFKIYDEDQEFSKDGYKMVVGLYAHEDKLIHLKNQNGIITLNHEQAHFVDSLFYELEDKTYINNTKKIYNDVLEKIKSLLKNNNKKQQDKIIKDFFKKKEKIEDFIDSSIGYYGDDEIFEQSPFYNFIQNPSLKEYKKLQERTFFEEDFFDYVTQDFRNELKKVDIKNWDKDGKNYGLTQQGEFVAESVAIFIIKHRKKDIDPTIYDIYKKYGELIFNEMIKSYKKIIV